jgi:hypothetical protein
MLHPSYYESYSAELWAFRYSEGRFTEGIVLPPRLGEDGTIVAFEMD